MNTTYLVGKTLEGETMLLPKQLIEQGDIITINENDQFLHNEQIEESLSNDDDNSPLPTSPPPQITSVTDILKTPYISQGNVVRCVTGSFD